MSASKNFKISTRAVEIRRVAADGTTTHSQDLVTVEEPLEIRVKGEAIAVTMRTPGHDHELAAGFLWTEGLLRQSDVIVEIAHCRQDVPQRENILNVFLTAQASESFVPPSSRGPVNVSCGLCGKTSIEAVHQHFPPIEVPESAAPELLVGLPEKLRQVQTTFAKTGGLHAAGLFDQVGNLVVAREDVGRHNAVDKVIGHALLTRRLPLGKHILLVSGRASFEILQKALAARIGVVVAVSAPSSLAVEFARESGQILVGFLRGGSMNFYS